jgi:hypothetical protein
MSTSSTLVIAAYNDQEEVISALIQCFSQRRKPHLYYLMTTDLMSTSKYKGHTEVTSALLFIQKRE